MSYLYNIKKHVANSADIVFLIDRQNLLLMELSQAALLLIDVNRESLIDKNFFEQETVISIFPYLTAEKVKKESFFAADFFYLNEDITIQWFIERFQENFIFIRGIVSGGGLNQIRTKHYYEEMLAVMPGEIYWKDKNSAFLGCNNNQAKKAGLKSRHDIVGKTAKDLPWAINAEKLRNIDLQILETGREITIEEPGVKADGSRGVYLSKKRPLYNARKERMGVFGISFDITAEKQVIKLVSIEKERAEKTAHQMKLIAAPLLMNSELRLRR